jgi:DNA-directed RNA polymerase subunit RPC12/RpoP
MLGNEQGWRCDSCGAPLAPMQGMSYRKCMYCNTVAVEKERVKVQRNTSSYEESLKKDYTRFEYIPDPGEKLEVPPAFKVTIIWLASMITEKSLKPSEQQKLLSIPSCSQIRITRK